MVVLPLVALANILSHPAKSGFPAFARLSVSDTMIRLIRNKVGRRRVNRWIDEDEGCFIFNWSTVSTGAVDADGE